MNETSILINIGIYKLLGFIGTLIGVAWYISHRLTKVETKVQGFEIQLTSLTANLTGTLLAKAFGSGSPVSLKPIGEKFLNESGLKIYIDDNADSLLSQCQSGRLMSNQYDIQESVFLFFDHLDFGDFEATLKESAFKYGWGMETVRRIGAIYFRDICLIKKGFKPEDLDNPKS